MPGDVTAQTNITIGVTTRVFDLGILFGAIFTSMCRVDLLTRGSLRSASRVPDLIRMQTAAMEDFNPKS